MFLFFVTSTLAVLDLVLDLELDLEDLEKRPSKLKSR